MYYRRIPLYWYFYRYLPSIGKFKNPANTTTLYTTPMDPFHIRLNNLFCSLMPVRTIEAMLCFIADEVEARGAAGTDLDPGETADWLRGEAAEIGRWSNYLE